MVLKLNVAAAIGLGFEMPLPLERQSDSRAAPVWHAESVEPLIVVFSEVKTRLKGFDVSLYCAVTAVARSAAKRGEAVFMLAVIIVQI